MTYATHTYAGAQIAELHRTGAERRRVTGSARASRVALVIAVMRSRERRRPDRAASLAVASPGAPHR